MRFLDSRSDRPLNKELRTVGVTHLKAFRMLVCFGLAFGALLISGCGGCSDSTADKDKDKDKKEEKKKIDFDSLTAVVLPGYYPPSVEEREAMEEEAREKAKETGRPSNALMWRLDPAFRYNKTKLGHWIGVDFSAVANNFNADGFLETKSVSINRPVPIDNTDYFASTTRPVGLPKGEWKNFETSVFLPRRDQMISSTSIQYEIDRSASGIPMISKVDPVNLMKSYQYHLVILSTRSDSLRFISLLDSMKLASGSADVSEAPEFYIIVPTIKDDPVPLPRHALNWTTIAYIVWDDLDPDTLDRDQQQAMIDWLHFGGQIIFSGPDCLDRLQTSFLADYLPGQFDESVSFTKDDVKDLNEHWTVNNNNALDDRSLQIAEKVPLTGIRFKPHSDANFIENSSEFALERRVGRGRVVATAFSLRSRTIRRWRSFQSFFNSALLRHPRREFGKTQIGNTSFKYVDDGTTIFDPLMGSTVRFVSRDLSSTGTDPHCSLDVSQDPNLTTDPLNSNYYGGLGGQVTTADEYHLPSRVAKRPASDSFHYGGFNETRQSGVGGWNDQSGIAEAARDTLRSAARISPPSADSIARMLGVYLLVLVPLNWLFFKLIGRVEWAWVAAPIIAVVGAFTVVKMASLDIGFVRSITQVSVLEAHGEHSRAHLADYTALYTSLSTRYDVGLDNLSTQSLPFAKQSPGQFKRDETISKVNLNRSTNKELQNFLVRSNSTGLLHTESMLELNGTFTLRRENGSNDGWTVSNSSPVNAEAVGVIRCLEPGKFEGAWIGALDSEDESNPLIFKSLNPKEIRKLWGTESDFVSSREVANGLWDLEGLGDEERISLSRMQRIPGFEENWSETVKRFEQEYVARNMDPNPDMNTITRSMFIRYYENANLVSDVNVSLLFDCVVGNLKLGVGEVRLIGQTKDKLGRTKFDPEATQVNRQTLVVVHLRPADIASAGPDLNLFADFNRDEGVPIIEDRDDVSEATDSDEDEEESKDTFDVVLTDFGNKKPEVIQVIKAATGQNLIGSCPVTIRKDLRIEACEAIRVKVEAAGGSIEIRVSGSE